jgi:hypothetical protein
MRSSAQNRLTAVGRVFAIVRKIRSTSRSKFLSLTPTAPSATPIAAATPIAGAPRTTMSRIACATAS